MKLYTLFTLAIAVFSSLVSGLAIRYEDMSDFEIAKLYITNETLANSAGAISYPVNNDTWYVGENVNVTFNDVDKEHQTVSIFFFQLTDTLAGGNISERVFPFIVPASAVSPVGGTSLLLAVRRQNRYLQTVDSVVLKVLPTKPA